MNNLDILKKQHSEVLAIMKSIETLTAAGPEEKSNEIAFNINALSGKLKMHLMSEDQFLYPELMKSENQTVRNTAQRFSDEMGNLASLFITFVGKYNTSFKINQCQNLFIDDSKTIFRQIKERINQEDGKLYPLVED